MAPTTMAVDFAHDLYVLRTEEVNYLLTIFLHTLRLVEATCGFSVQLKAQLRPVAIYFVIFPGTLKRCMRPGVLRVVEAEAYSGLGNGLITPLTVPLATSGTWAILAFWTPSTVSLAMRSRPLHSTYLHLRRIGAYS